MGIGLELIRRSGPRPPSPCVVHLLISSHVHEPFPSGADMSKEKTPEQRAAYLNLRLTHAIHRAIVEILGPDGAKALALEGSPGIGNTPATGPWAIVEGPTLRYEELSAKFVRGECGWESLVDASAAVLDAWKQAAHAFAEKQQANKPTAPRAGARV